jgi:hypothetical protein
MTMAREGWRVAPTGTRRTRARVWGGCVPRESRASPSGVGCAKLGDLGTWQEDGLRALRIEFMPRWSESTEET